MTAWEKQVDHVPERAQEEPRAALAAEITEQRRGPRSGSFVSLSRTAERRHRPDPAHVPPPAAARRVPAPLPRDGGEARHAVDEFLFLEQIERGERGGAADGVRRVRVAVVERLPAVRAAEKGVVHLRGGERRGQGTPPVNPFERQRKSGETPACSQANIVSVRPNPVATSSRMRWAPCFRAQGTPRGKGIPADRRSSRRA